MAALPSRPLAARPTGGAELLMVPGRVHRWRGMYLSCSTTARLGLLRST